MNSKCRCAKHSGISESKDFTVLLLLYVLYLLYLFYYSLFLCLLSSINVVSQITSSSSSSTEVFANKSSLFSNPANSAKYVGNVAPINPPKVINHGKPNLAPKPPNFLKLSNTGSSNNVNNNVNNDSNRKNSSVTRHQSMKSPRWNNLYTIFNHNTFNLIS